MKASQRNLPEMLNHVLYEFGMLHLSWTRLCQVKTPGETMTVYLEDFIIHARCIEEFFYVRRERMNDMKPWHFVSNYPCQSKRHPYIGRMNAELAHLTYARKKRGERGDWPYREVAYPLFSLALDFLRAIDSNNALMSYSDNRARTEALIQKFEGETSALTIPGAFSGPVASSSYPTTTSISA